MNKLEPTRAGYYLWNYVPSLAAAIVFIFVFLLLTLLVSWRMFKTKTWFSISFALGGFFEFIGYCARASSASKTGKIMPFAIQNIFILLGPALFAASIYMCLSRITRGIHAEHHSLINPRNSTRIFVSGDILSFIVQGSAAGLMVTGKNAKLGEGIVIAGLLIQIIMFGLFGVTAITFHKRVKRKPTAWSSIKAMPWPNSMRMLFIVSALIMIRSIFRVIEYASGHDGYLLKYEWPLYIFDSVLMAVVMFVYYLWYPSWITAEYTDAQVPLA
ncbi:RTA1 like protein [Curvularia clavata]|uniref:RTA1 like protein n=1 Tax=Curvularia clavata TaxID=95742 RepID=A0A9Q8ZIH0_CURCL|nr:RTA1 like protein [Curvularia clavata]